jgi:polysaccharide biosynthesis protein PelB
VDNQESSLFSGWSLLLFGVIVGVALLVLFPGKRLLDELNNKTADRTSTEYLKVLVANTPDDGQLRIRLANELIAFGRLDEAETTLAPLLNKDEFANQAQFLTIQIHFQEYFIENRVTAKQTRKAQLINTINSLYPLLTDISSLDLLAQWSNELAASELAAKIYRRIVILLNKDIPDEVNNDNDFFWLLLGIQNSYAETINKNAEYYAIKQLQALLAADQPETALKQAKTYVKQFDQSTAILEMAIKIAGYADQPQQSRDWGRLALTQFGANEEKIQQQIDRELAANEPANSLLWVQTTLASNEVSSPSLIAFGANLASSLGEKESAAKLGLQQLQLSPEDPSILASQVQYELAIKDLPNALRYAQQRVGLDPNNVEARKQLANVALWSGNSNLAMQQWSWLYKKTGNEAYLKDAAKIGKALFQYDAVAKQYEYLSNIRRLTDSEIIDLYKVLQAAGFKDAGRQQLKRYLKKWPEHKQAWIRLAATEELTGHYRAASQTLKAVEQKFGKTAQLSLKQSELLLQAGDFDAAWLLLSAQANTSAPEESAFWQLYAQMAWMHGHEAEAEQAYNNLLINGNLEPDMVSRYLQLSRTVKNDEQQLELLLIAWDKFKQPEYLLDAIDLSARMKKPEQTEELIAIAENNMELFEKTARYWLLKGGKASRQKNHSLARHYLLQALGIDRQSTDVQIAVLWHMIDYGSDVDLRALASSIATAAAENVELWKALGAAYRRLGEPGRAIPWYTRAVQKTPNDYLLLLGYAEALREAGKLAKADNIRKMIVHKIRPELVANLSPVQANNEEFKRRYGVVIQEELGAESAEKWFNWMQRENAQLKQALFDEYRITWLLAEGRMPAARRYVLKSLQERVALPAWQQMAIAVYDNDIDAIEEILKSPRELLPTDRVVGLRTVGRETQALETARKHLESSQWENELYILRRQAADLGVRNPNGLALTGKINTLGDLDMQGIKAEAAFTRGVNSFWLGYEFLDLSSNSSNLIVQPDQSPENNLQIKWRYMGLRNEFWLQGRAGLRPDKDLLGMQGGWKYSIWEGWAATIRGAYNELTDESAAFRLMGARDGITVGFNGEISKRDFFALNVYGRNYKTRFGSNLGTGIGAEFVAGYRIQFAHPGLEVRLHGNITEADLVSQLPAEMQAILPPGAGVENVLSKSYKEIGLNFRIQDGEFRPFGFVERNIHYFLDAGVFFSDPYVGPGVAIEAGIGMRLFAHDDLSLVGRYIDAQGGVDTSPTQAIELRYSIRFD